MFFIGILNALFFFLILSYADDAVQLAQCHVDSMHVPVRNNSVDIIMISFYISYVVVVEYSFTKISKRVYSNENF